MIFVTIGTQAPFDRFIEAMDEIAALIDEPIIAQTFESTYIPKHIQIVSFIPPDEFHTLFSKARVIVSHAGMGSIISALTQEKPIIIFPRLASLGEHRNDHQIVTAMRMNELGYAYVAYDKMQLKNLILQRELKPLRKIGKTASDSLIESILSFIRQC
jgi:UDP-N-acetylglucosamine transferase subunit ALG13